MGDNRLLRVVLDLDETILHFPQNQTPPKTGLDIFRLGNGSIIFLRPGFYEFLQFLGAYFDEIYVFTAATKTYADDVIAVLFNGVTLNGVWTRDDCELTGSAVFKSLRAKRSPGGDAIDGPRTLMIDDRADVTEKNVYVRGENHIVVRPFEGDPNDRVFIDLIPQLMAWTHRKNNLL